VHHHGPEAISAKVPEASARPGGNGQLSLFTEYVNHPAIDRLRELKLEALSPMQAFDALRKLKEQLEAR
jgi:hypothetical protein